MGNVGPRYGALPKMGLLPASVVVTPARSIRREGTQSHMTGDAGGRFSPCPKGPPIVVGQGLENVSLR